MRGLKLGIDVNKGDRYQVASFTDAWIETSRQELPRNPFPSHLLQMRGLKLLSRPPDPEDQGRIFYRCVDWNLLISDPCTNDPCRIFYRCVDWNSPLMRIRSKVIVASFTDAWIETWRIGTYLCHPHRRIFYRCVDWNRFCWFDGQSG